MDCPLKLITTDRYYTECDKEECAWWCAWANCCAMVAISSEISDKAHDIIQSMKE